MPLSGYLVAWQYYQLSHDDSWRDTHVTVWRSEGDNYYRISDIILTPDNKTGGQRFQYVHNEVIRVEQGDIIGVYSTGRYFICITSSDGNHTILKKLSIGTYQDQPSLPKDGFSNVRLWNISLRAFIAGK